MRTTNDYRPTTALSRHLKIHSAIVIHLDRGGKIELGERNLLPGSVVIEHPERSTGDRVVSYFFNMLVAEDQRRRGDTGGPFILARLRAAHTNPDPALAPCLPARATFVLRRSARPSRWQAPVRDPDHSHKRKTSPTTSTDRSSPHSRIRHTTDTRSPSGNRSSDENRESECALHQNRLRETKDERRFRYAVRRAFRRRRGRPKRLQWSVQWQRRDRRPKFVQLRVQPQRRVRHRKPACRHAGPMPTQTLRGR